jgi:hypothetical protein
MKMKKEFDAATDSWIDDQDDPNDVELEELLARAEAAAVAGKEPEEDVVSAAESAAKPDISKLKDALDANGIPIFTAGDRIVIERRITFLPDHPWLDTRSYRVQSVDPQFGTLKLWDEVIGQFAMDNFKKGPTYGQIYKMAGRSTVSPQKKRGRPRKNPLPEPRKDGDPVPVKKKRGRPPGSKNRNKDVIRAEKAAKKAAKKSRR